MTSETTFDACFASASPRPSEDHRRVSLASKQSSVSSSASVASTPSIREEIKLRQHLGLFNGVAIIVGIIVGSGIFISPKGVIQEAGGVGPSLIIWGLCGVVCLIGAMCYAELGTCILKSGADYAYIGEAYGSFPAFLYLWVAVVIFLPTGNAITALTFASYILEPMFPNCGPPKVCVSLLAALCITRKKEVATKKALNYTSRLQRAQN